MPTLDPTRFDLPELDEWPAGDSRQLNFTVETNGEPKDLSNDTIRWSLLPRPYSPLSDAVLDGDDAGVDIRTDQVVDPTAGEFRVDIAEGATAGLWGEYFQRVEINPPGDDRQSFAGDVIIEDLGGD